MKEKIKDAAIKTFGYIIAACWLIVLIVVPLLIAAGIIKLITMMFGG